MEKKKYSNKKEILRFIVVGCAATIVDYLVKLIASSALNGKVSDSARTLIGYACGFLVGVVVNYILSTIWVFQNVDKTVNTKSAKSATLFFILSLIGFGIGLGITYGMGAIIQYGSGGKFNINGFNIFQFVQSLKDPNFWLFTLVFVFQTCVVLVWNYLSRKKWIYTSSKFDINNNHFRTTFREELNKLNNK